MLCHQPGVQQLAQPVRGGAAGLIPEPHCPDDLPILPDFYLPKQNWAECGTKTKSTQPSLKPTLPPSTHDLLPLQCRVLHSLCRRSPFVVELLDSFQSHFVVMICQICLISTCPSRIGQTVEPKQSQPNQVSNPLCHPLHMTSFRCSVACCTRCAGAARSWWSCWPPSSCTHVFILTEFVPGGELCEDEGWS